MPLVSSGTRASACNKGSPGDLNRKPWTRTTGSRKTPKVWSLLLQSTWNSEFSACFPHPFLNYPVVDLVSLTPAVTVLASSLSKFSLSTAAWWSQLSCIMQCSLTRKNHSRMEEHKFWCHRGRMPQRDGRASRGIQKMQCYKEMWYRDSKATYFKDPGLE